MSFSTVDSKPQNDDIVSFASWVNLVKLSPSAQYLQVSSTFTLLSNDSFHAVIVSVRFVRSSTFLWQKKIESIPIIRRSIPGISGWSLKIQIPNFDQKFSLRAPASSQNVMNTILIGFFLHIHLFYNRNIWAPVFAKSPLVRFHDIFKGVLILLNRALVVLKAA